MKFRKKPVVIDAWQWDETKATLELTGCIYMSYTSHGENPYLRTDLRIQTLEGVMDVNRGDWIVKGVKGEYYPVKDDIFRATYESAEGEQRYVLPW